MAPNTGAATAHFMAARRLRTSVFMTSPHANDSLAVRQRHCKRRGSRRGSRSAADSGGGILCGDGSHREFMRLLSSASMITASLWLVLWAAVTGEPALIAVFPFGGQQ